MRTAIKTISILSDLAALLVVTPLAHAQTGTLSLSDASYIREIPENTAANTSVGSHVRATDADGDTLTHILGGRDADSFDIISSSGRIQTKVEVTYDYEAKSTYRVRVRAESGEGNSDYNDFMGL